MQYETIEGIKGNLCLRKGMKIMKRYGIALISLMIALYLSGCGNQERGKEAGTQIAQQGLKNIQINTQDEIQEPQRVLSEPQVMQTVWEGDLGDGGEGQGFVEDTDKKQGLTEGAGERAVEFLGSDSSIIQECYMLHRGEKTEVPSSEMKGLVQMVSGFIEELQPVSDVILSFELLDSVEDFKKISEEEMESHYICLQFEQPPIAGMAYGKRGKWKLNLECCDIYILQIDKERGAVILWSNGEYKGQISFYAWGAMEVDDKVEGFMQRYEEWKSGWAGRDRGV